MINTSDAYKKAIKKNRILYHNVEISFADGSTESADNLELFAFQIADGTSNTGSFDIGAAIAKQLTIKLNNVDGKFDKYDFGKAVITARVGLELPDGKLEWLDKGTYIAEPGIITDNTITVNAFDYMIRFDKEYSASKLEYPATLGQIVRDACSCCNVTLAPDTASFDNDDFIVQERPDDSVTFRQILQWVGQIACKYSRINSNGKLSLQWYDVTALESDWIKNDNGVQTDQDGTINTNIAVVDKLSSGSSIETDDVVITGIKVTEEAEDAKENVYMSGADGYVLDITGNKLIQNGKGATVASFLGKRLNGLKFRTLSVNTMGNPAIEAGDLGLVTDRKRKDYKTIFTNVTYVANAAQNLMCGAEAPTRRSSVRYSQATQVYKELRKKLQKQKSAVEASFENLKNAMKSIKGLYPISEQQEDGSFILYLCDKPTLKESQVVIKMNAEGWGMSTDGGKTWNVGALVDGTTITKILNAIGINAEWINTRGLKAEDNDGNITFEIDAATGKLRANASDLQIQGKDFSQIAQEKAEAEVNDFINNTYASDINSLQSQLDGQLETYFYDYEPSLQNLPASEWTSTQERKKHEGDLFYWTSKGYAYRFLQDGSAWKWQLVQDTDVTKALAVAQKAQDTADHKRRVFVTRPDPPYDIGDLWAQGASGDLMRCRVSREEGNYSASDWEKASRYTDDSALTQFLNGTYKDTLSELQDQLDGKSEVWYQNTDPALNWNTRKNVAWTGPEGTKILTADGNEILLTWEAEKALHAGDLWYNTRDNTQWIYQDGNWEPATIPDYLIDKIDGKSQVFARKPAPPYEVNDLYFTGKEILVCVSAREEGSYSASDWTRKDNYTDDSALIEFIENIYTDEIARIQESLDGQIMTWFYDYVPTLANLPASAWKTEKEKADHEGDLFYNRKEKRSYRFFKNGNKWNWEQVLDPEVSEAMEKAQAAQDTADGKRRTFVTTPKAPYDVGDLWVQGESGDIMRCRTPKTKSQQYSSTDWVKASKYTDDSTFNTFVDGVFKDTIGSLKTQIDGKIETWYQENDPSSKWNKTETQSWTDAAGNKILDAAGKEILLIRESEKAEHEGDLWHNTGNNTQWIYKSGIWQPQSIPDELLDKIDGKSSVYTVQPTPPYYSGDMWVTRDAEGKVALKTSTVNRVGGEFSASDWIDFKYADKKDIEAAVENYDTSLGQNEIFNKLTKGGKNQGIFLKDGTLYVNAEYILVGLLAGERINARGIKVIDDDGNITLEIDKKGNIAIAPTSFALGGKGIADIARSEAVKVLEDIPTGNLLKGYQLTEQNVKDYWTVNGTYTTGNEDADCGHNALKVNDQYPQLKINTETNNAVKNTGNYTFSVWIKASKSASVSIYINGVGDMLLSVSTTWKRIQLARNVSEISSNTNTRLSINGAGSSDGSKYDLYIYAPELEFAYTSTQIFNLFTNGGKAQGIYMYKGLLYLNGQYMKSFSVVTDALASNAVTTEKLQAGAVTVEKITLKELAALGASLSGFKMDNVKIYIYSEEQGASTGLVISRLDGDIEKPYISFGMGGSADSPRLKLNADGIAGADTNALALKDDTDLATDQWQSGRHHNLGKTEFNGAVTVHADFKVTGTKSIVAKTQNYGSQAFYCYETPTPTLGDFGGSVIGEDGLAVILIDDIFRECTDTEIEYYVFLQREGEGEAWVSEKTDTYFSVRGTPGLYFAWELKARQLNKEYIRFNAGKEDREVDFKTVDLEKAMFAEREKIIMEMEGELA